VTEHDPPHDILAADEFGIGTRDERIPPDPTGIAEPHDVLAAEEFAMPAGGEAPVPHSNRPEPRTLVPLITLVAFAALLVLLGRRRS
jgi:hypothetical protein